MELNDVEFVSTIRNQSTSFLHDKNKYTLEESENWFNKSTDPYFIISKDGQDVGYVRTSNWDGDSLYIGMDLSSGSRGQGLAIPIYEMLMNKLSNEYDIDTFYLEVLSDNTRARHIYKKLGFVELESIYYSDTVTSIKMKYTP